ncbi:hypothetical protein [Cryptosporangium phraense]|uniref:hypothetical protein n=1 Tax=Cryptosporangium phraense TaxID=2593070 RepID=UPI00197AB3FA|nr:hypothetical protein [Cryptosporangium phraense]
MEAGVAQPIATVAHVHLSSRPLVFVPLSLAGEANAPLAAMVGTSVDEPELLIVPQPRDRALRFEFAARLARVFLDYLASFPVSSSDDGPFAADSPQVLVPNRAGLAFVRLLGRSTRFRRATGPYPVDPSVPVLGRWLTWFAERSEHPGSSSALAATEALTLHWATGQSAFEDNNLAALMGWIEPPPGVSGAAAARAAEDPLRWPPAGPATDPTFDNEVLGPLIRGGSVSALERALASQLEPTWGLMFRALATLSALPAGASVASRWASDCDAYAGFWTYLAEDGLPQARRDGAVAAARRLAQLERAQASYDVARSFDDPLVMAQYRVTGEAFAGTVLSVDATRRITNDKGNLVTRPLVLVQSSDPVHLPVGTQVGAPSRPKQSGTVLDVTSDLVTVELDKGFGRGKTPAPGVLPSPGEPITYSSVLASAIRGPALPSADETPWTHGGPPTPYVPSDLDAGEDWE